MPSEKLDRILFLVSANLSGDTVYCPLMNISLMTGLSLHLQTQHIGTLFVIVLFGFVLICGFFCFYVFIYVLAVKIITTSIC